MLAKNYLKAFLVVFIFLLLFTLNGFCAYMSMLYGLPKNLVIGVVGFVIGYSATFTFIVCIYYLIKYQNDIGAFENCPARMGEWGDAVLDFFARAGHCLTLPCRRFNEDYRDRLQSPIRSPLRSAPRLPPRDYQRTRL